MNRNMAGRAAALTTATVLIAAVTGVPAFATEADLPDSTVPAFPVEDQDDPPILDIPQRSDVDAETHSIVVADSVPVYAAHRNMGPYNDAQEITGFLSAGDVVRLSPSAGGGGYAARTDSLDVPGHWIRLEDNAIHTQTGERYVWVNTDWLVYYTEDETDTLSFEEADVVELPDGSEVPVLQVPDRPVTEAAIETEEIGVIARDWVPVWAPTTGIGGHPRTEQDPLAYVRPGSVLHVEYPDRLDQPGRFTQSKDPLIQEQLGVRSVWIPTDAFDVIDEDYDPQHLQTQDDDSADLEGPVFRPYVPEPEDDEDAEVEDPEPPTLIVHEKPHHAIGDPTEYVTVLQDQAPVYDPGSGGSSPPADLQVMAYLSAGDVLRFDRGDPQDDGDWIRLSDSVLFEQADARNSEGWIAAEWVTSYEPPEVDEPEEDSTQSEEQSPDPTETPSAQEPETPEPTGEDDDAGPPAANTSLEAGEPSDPTGNDEEPGSSEAPAPSESVDSPTQTVSPGPGGLESAAGSDAPTAESNGGIGSDEASGSLTVEDSGSSPASPSTEDSPAAHGDTDTSPETVSLDPTDPDSESSSSGTAEDVTGESASGDAAEEGAEDSEEPQTSDAGGVLAQTGAQTIALAVLAACVIGIGAVLLVMVRRRRTP